MDIIVHYTSSDLIGLFGHDYHFTLNLGQPMPSDLTLSQLLVLLTERGLQPGQAMLDFTMKLRAKKVPAKGEKRLKTDDGKYIKIGHSLKILFNSQY